MELIRINFDVFTTLKNIWVSSTDSSPYDLSTLSVKILEAIIPEITANHEVRDFEEFHEVNNRYRNLRSLKGVLDPTENK